MHYDAGLAVDADRSRAEIDAFLAFYPPAIVRQVAVLRRLVHRVAPGAVERLRPGWRLIGYDLPITRHGTYFAYIAPEQHHVHLGFEHGTLMSDAQHVLEGAHLHLRKVRYLTFLPTERIPGRVVVSLTREAARIAALSRGERQLLAASRDEKSRAEPDRGSRRSTNGP